MLSVHFLLLGTVALLLVLYLLRRRTRIVNSQVSVSDAETESANLQQPTWSRWGKPPELELARPTPSEGLDFVFRPASICARAEHSV
jgi:hypothetical protein